MIKEAFCLTSCQNDGCRKTTKLSNTNNQYIPKGTMNFHSTQELKSKREHKVVNNLLYCQLKFSRKESEEIMKEIK